MDDEASLNRYRARYQRVESTALNPRESQDLIARIIRELWGVVMQSTTEWRKSSFSGGGSGDNCVEIAATWQKSSFSGSDPAGNCLEVASGIPHIHLRESDTSGAVLTTRPAALRALLAQLKEG